MQEILLIKIMTFLSAGYLPQRILKIFYIISELLSIIFIHKNQHFC